MHNFHNSALPIQGKIMRLGLAVSRVNSEKCKITCAKIFHHFNSANSPHFAEIWLDFLSSARGASVGLPTTHPLELLPSAAPDHPLSPPNPSPCPATNPP